MFGGKRENKQNCADRQVIKNVFAEYSREQQAKHALIPRLPGIGGTDTVCSHQDRNSRKKNCQHENDHGEGAFGILDGRIAKGPYPVAHGFHPSDAVQPLAKTFRSNQ